MVRCVLESNIHHLGTKLPPTLILSDYIHSSLSNVHNKCVYHGKCSSVLRQYFGAGLPRFRHQEEVSTNIIKSVLLSWLGTRHTTYASPCTVTWYSKLNYTLCHTRSWIYTSTLLIRRSCKCIEHHRWAAGGGSSIQLWQNFASYCI